METAEEGLNQVTDGGGTAGDPSLDQVIGPLQERRRDRQAEGLGGLEVDHQLELGGLFDRQVTRLGTLILSTYVAKRSNRSG